MSDLPEIEREAGASNGRYVLRLDGHEAELTYTVTGPGRISADHTGVPEALGGRGIGRLLAGRLVADARAEGVKVAARCPFVQAQARRHPDWADVIEG